ncbi:tetratricopeptide repeat protein [Sphingobacterium sp. HJSM2_6]|uniref:tetratricopeptide repeat protein n=1 Tax=Sphingobacterium sp. HJSM2_6 TaxID=3366264 RepID=UPI003BECA353
MRRVLGWKVVACAMLFFGQQLMAQEVNQDQAYKEQLAMIEAQLKRGEINAALQQIEESILKYPKAAEIYYAKSLLYAQARNLEVAIAAAKDAVTFAPENLTFANHLLDLYKGSGDLESAVGLLDKVIETKPNNREIYREKIMLLHAGKKSDAALQVYDLAKGKFGESDTLDVLKAEILMDLKKEDEAIQILNNWRAKKSQIRQVYSSLGYIYLDKNRAKEALPVLEEGLLNAKDDLLYLDLADVHSAMKKNDLAFVNLQKAFASKQINFAEKHRAMLNVLNSKGTFNMVQKQDLANSLVLNHPRIPDSHMFKGDLMWQNGELPEAKSLYLTTVSMQPQHVDAWRKLLNVEIAMNDLDNAIVDGHEALKYNPGNVVLTYFVGVAYMIKKDSLNARQYLEGALNQSANENPFVQSMIYGSLGDLYHELKLESASDVAYEEAIRLDSTNVSAMNNLAYYLSLRKKELEKAASYAKRAVELDPQSGTFQDTYAWVLFQQGDYSQALHWIEEAIKNSSESAVLYEHYGDILVKSGKTKDAIKQWTKALTLADQTAIDQEKIKLKISEKKYIE